MDSDERRNKIIVGVVIIVVTVAIVALIVLKTSSAALTCQLSDVDPSKTKNQFKAVASADNKALAFFDGHLRYQLTDSKEKKVYLPVELSSVQQFDVDKQGQQRLLLKLNCAEIDISLTRSDKDVVSASEIKVHLTSANGKLSSCTINKPGLELIAYPEKSHFVCESFELTCVADDTPAPTTPAPTTKKPTTDAPVTKAPTRLNNAADNFVDVDESSEQEQQLGAIVTVVTLSVQKFEFELNGNADKHKKLEFSTPAAGCKKPALF